MLAICLAMLETEEDQRRFTKLFEAHEKKIYTVALHILGDTPIYSPHPPQERCTTLTPW